MNKQNPFPPNIQYVIWNSLGSLCSSNTFHGRSLLSCLVIIKEVNPVTCALVLCLSISCLSRFLSLTHTHKHTEQALFIVLISY
jgi:hypothetical protein